jgi:translation initiation factor 3 subunit G
VKDKLKASGAGSVVCRLCKGAHFTAKCPYKDTLAGLDSADAPPTGPDDEVAAPAAAGAAAPAATGGRYVPPSMRGNRGPGERMPGGPGGAGGSRDDLPTLRVTNISEDVEEADLRDLFAPFGRVARVYVGRDRETGAGKGFAFVSFEDRAQAQRAMEKLHGRGYDNLILSVQWSRKSARCSWFGRCGADGLCRASWGRPGWTLNVLSTTMFDCTLAVLFMQTFFSAPAAVLSTYRRRSPSG